MKKQQLTGQAGFTLIETMMAMAIFTIGILGVFGMQSAAIKENLAANTITTGTTWTADRVERLLSLDYADLSDPDKDGCGGLNDRTAATADGNGTSGTVPEYKIYWNVASGCALPAIPASASEQPKLLRIIVTKVNGSGQEVEAGVFNYIKQFSRK